MSECFEGKGCTGEGQWMDYHYWQLAGLYRKATCLWKKDGRHYLDSDRRYRAYQKIQEAMGVPGLTLVGVVLKIREMRRMYVQELKRLLDRELCGCCHDPSIAWFYDLHRFLYPYLDYDEAVELHNVARPAHAAAAIAADPRETDDRDPDRDSEDRYHSDCPLKRRDRLCDGRYPAPMHSISSPAVSLPEVKAQPGTCPRSRVDASSERRTVRRRSVGVDVVVGGGGGSSSCCERSCHRILSASNASTGTRQERCREFRIQGLSGTSSNTCETDSSDESFSTIVGRCLSKLDRPFAIRAKMEILRLLRSLMEESKKFAEP
ncbi:uncharacterized protein LOC117222600 [Megalopta genalis]|uniref:uncharacterized protein LOC117222600 n=1 Tax=Megalopta genalis TaxID=115081 RepID=UPI003FCF3F6C